MRMTEIRDLGGIYGTMAPEIQRQCSKVVSGNIETYPHSSCIESGGPSCLDLPISITEIGIRERHMGDPGAYESRC